MRQIMRIARRPVADVLAGEVVGILAHVERPEADCPGRFEPLHQLRICSRGRQFAVDLAAGPRRQALHVEQVLDREGDARQRVALALLDLGIDQRRTLDRTLGQHIGEGAQPLIVGLDAAERSHHHAMRGALHRRDRPGDLGNAGRRLHARKTGAGSISSLTFALSSNAAILAAVLRLALTPARCSAVTFSPRTGAIASIHWSKSGSLTAMRASPEFPLVEK
jgi:hypothetical protein